MFLSAKVRKSDDNAKYTCIFSVQRGVSPIVTWVNCKTTRVTLFFVFYNLFEGTAQ
jgi:hypothetical protein